MPKPSMAALIEILKQQDHSTKKRQWDELEDHVKHVYETLLNLKGEQVVVARNVQMRGRNGQNHQIDVYYEFEQASVRHRVAIECKNTRRPIDISEAITFSGVIGDCPGVIGIMVSAGGYQKGAKKFAEDNGISAITLDELPSIGRLLAMRLEYAAIPDEKTVGEPFWTLYEIEDGKINGAPYGHKQGNEILSVLFFSKKQAEMFLSAQKLENRWAVRGLSQRHLRTFILTVDSLAGRFLFSLSTLNSAGEESWGGYEISRSDLIADYYVSDIPIPEEPMVMPSRRKYMRP